MTSAILISARFDGGHVIFVNALSCCMLVFYLFVNVRFFELFLPQRLKLKKRISQNISAFFCVHPQCVIYRAWYFPHCYSLCSWSFLIEVETTLAGIEYQFYIKDGHFIFPSLLRHRQFLEHLQSTSSWCGVFWSHLEPVVNTKKRMALWRILPAPLCDSDSITGA